MLRRVLRKWMVNGAGYYEERVFRYVASRAVATLMLGIFLSATFSKGAMGGVPRVGEKEEQKREEAISLLAMMKTRRAGGYCATGTQGHSVLPEGFPLLAEGGSGGGEQTCQEDLSGFGNLQDFKADLSDWVDSGQNDGSAPVLTWNTPGDGAQVETTNAVFDGTVSDASEVAIQIIVDDVWVLYQGNDVVADDGSFQISLPIAFTICLANGDAVSDYAYLPMGPTEVTLRATDKGGNITEITRQFEVTNSRMNHWLSKMEQLRQEINNWDGNPTDKELLLLLVDVGDAALNAHQSGGDQAFLNQMQDWKAFLQNWDGTFEGEQLATQEEIQEMIDDADTAIQILQSEEMTPQKRSLLALPAIIPIIIAGAVGSVVGFIVGCGDFCKNKPVLAGLFFCTGTVFSAWHIVKTGIIRVGAGVVGLAGMWVGACVACIFSYLDLC